ncbi:hypothetical protein N7474_006476 [Penicillium riverlandense]|uniref:uncharacterized protein n=1 Tax=Penicillium riverlandense TaxID=1903569 RepID=UPI002547D7E7|nr:uncharacterized protein N7474_006476 [Penicillium riverlandense]KAJ5814699.1 hypothetical protein N7474_006476 [Penicillium riverlandense]
MAENEQRHASPSIDSATTNTGPSESSTPPLSAQVSTDPEKGARPEKTQTSEQKGPEDPEAQKQDVAPMSTPATPAPGPPPDGGAKAWFTVLGAFCGLFVSIGVFQTYYESHQLSGMSTSTVTWITSLETFVMFLGVSTAFSDTTSIMLTTHQGPVFGTLFDNFGPRWLILAGTILHVFGLMMASLSSEYYQFLLSQGICSPLGASAVFYACINSVSTWFAKRRAFALGVTAAGSSLGGVIFPIMVTQLIPKVGFAWTMRICAFMILALLGVSNLTVRSRLQHRRKPFHILNFLKPLTELRFVLTVAGAFCVFWGMFLPFTFVITQAMRYGMSEHLANYLVPILNAASIFGRTVPGYIADKIGRFNVLILTTFLSAILVLALWLPARGNVPAIIFSALYGFSSGAFVSLAPAVVAQISDLREVGVRNGTFFAVISFAALTGTPIGGALVPDVLHGSYTKLQIFCGVVIFAGATFFVAARTVVGGFKLNKV